LVRAREAQFARMEALFAGRDDSDLAFVLFGEAVGYSAPSIGEVAQKMDEALDELATKAEVLRDRRVFRPVSTGFSVLGVHFVDQIFGSRVVRTDDDWQSLLLETPVGELPRPDLERDETWSLTRAAVEAFVASGLTVPLFTTPCIGSALNIAMNLYSEELLVAMLKDPKAAHRDLQIINDALGTMHRWYLETVPTVQLQYPATRLRAQPPGFGQIDGCSTHLLSAGVYRDFIAPLDDELLSVFPHGGMIHLCGKHARHIPVWREMKSLRAVQLSSFANEDLEAYFDQLRDDQMIYVGPSERVSLEWIMNVTGGHRIVLAEDLPEPLPTRRPHGSKMV